MFYVSFFAEELKSYRDFDLHYTSELPLSSFIPIPEDKEVDVIDVSSMSFLIWIIISYHHLLDITIIKKHSEKIFSTIFI
jgi:hypothetical protein